MALQPGKRFGRYELVARLGYGGMAETWLARLLGEAGFSKLTVLKKVLPEYSDDYDFTSMLISEARISGTLTHSNIAQVFDFGRVDGEYFLAMEFVDGAPLHEVIQHSLRVGWPALPVPVAVFVGAEICRGLHYAHTRRDESGKPLGIVHRDISPENVLVSYEGQVKIVDFGLAKARELSVQATEPGVVKGKYLFFSPEQARGDEVDGRTDVWATGITLYEMFCGKLPVEGPEFVVLPKLGRGEFPRPRELNPRVPQELEDILMKALAIRRDDRFESSRAFGDALAGFLDSTAPRFSGVTLSYFIQELFQEKLRREARYVEVPQSFLEELESWRGEPGTDVETNAPEEDEPEGDEPEGDESEGDALEGDESDEDDELDAPTVPVPAPGSAPAPAPVAASPRSAPVSPVRVEPVPARAGPSRALSTWKWSVGGGTALGWLALGILFLVVRKPAEEPAQVAAATKEESTAKLLPDPIIRSGMSADTSAEYERFIQQAKMAISGRRYQAAEDNYRAALKVQPGSIEAKEGLGFSMVLGNRGEESNEQAVKLLQEVVTEDILNSRAWFGLGMALQGLQQEDEAVEAYSKYLMLEPTGRFASDARRALKQLGAD